MLTSVLAVHLLVWVVIGPTVQDDRTASARRLLVSADPLTPADIAIVRDALRVALAGRFVVITLESPVGDSPGAAEYQLDDRGRIRFQRLRRRDPATSDLEITVNEVTDLPAVLCRDRKPREARLKLAFSYWRGKWQQVVGQVHMPTHELDMIWDLPAGQLGDGGMREMKGHRVRRVGFRVSPQLSHAFWIDVETLLPVRYSMSLWMDGKSHEVFETIEYPKGSIERPDGLSVPDCV